MISPLSASIFRKVIGVVIALLAWQIFALLSNTGLIPTLDAIGAELIEMLVDGTVAEHAGSSLATGLFGLFVAFSLAAITGGIAARNWAVDAALHPLVDLAYPVPKLALYPLVILLLGISWESRAAQVAIECYFPLFIHCYAGAKAVSRRSEWVAQNMEAGPWRTFRDLMVPTALPFVFTGLRVAIPIMLIVTTVTEFIGDSRGLGYLIARSAAYFDTASSLAVVAVLGVLGLIGDRIVVSLRQRTVFWEKATSL
jgi:NitT/TauT family transport system permease protein